MLPVKCTYWSIPRKIKGESVRDMDVRHAKMQWNSSQAPLGFIKDQRIHVRVPQRSRQISECRFHSVSNRLYGHLQRRLSLQLAQSSHRFGQRSNREIIFAKGDKWKFCCTNKGLSIWHG